MEDWLQAMWKWLDDKDIPLSRMVYWPLIPSVGDEQSVGLFRIPEATKLILFSGTAAPSAPAPPAATASEADTASGYPTEGVPSPSDSQGSLMQELLLRLHCQPVMEPPWLLAHHEKQLRTCVHANSPEGLLRSMHYAGSLLVGPQALGSVPSVSSLLKVLLKAGVPGTSTYRGPVARSKATQGCLPKICCFLELSF